MIDGRDWGIWDGLGMRSTRTSVKSVARIGWRFRRFKLTSLECQSTRFVPPSSNGTLYAEFDSNAYSSDGPLPVAYADYVYDSANAFVEGMQEIGIPYNPELNNGTNVGAKREPFTSDGFRRASSYDAYYLPAENRTNLHVATRAQVQSIILEQKVNGSLSATGVVYNDIASGMTLNVSANFEVILSAGAIQTPQVLMLSVRNELATS